MTRDNSIMMMTYTEATKLLTSCATRQEREAMAIRLIHDNIEPRHTHTAKLAYETGPSLAYEQLAKLYPAPPRDNTTSDLCDKSDINQT